jgi:hypothetical protein
MVDTDSTAEAARAAEAAGAAKIPKAVAKPKNPMVKCVCVTECTTRISGEIRHCYPGRIARFLKCPEHWATVESLKEED